MKRADRPRSAPRRTPVAELDLFAVTAPGLEQVCAAELLGLGVDATALAGGVAWRGDLPVLYRTSLMLRTATRVVARVGEFRARTFAELVRHAGRLPWSQYVNEGTEVVLRVTCRKSKLYHEGAVAERLAELLVGTVGARIAQRAPVADERTEGAPVVSLAPRHDDPRGPGNAQSLPPQLVVVRLLRDVCTISADTSGALLHQRGYRQAVAQAPLRETIAAAMLAAAGWRGDTPLVDPMCGSGTIAIEGALIARRIPPGLALASREPRRFAFETWPNFEPQWWADAVAAARADMRDETAVALIAADHHAAALTAARANAARAGVAADIEFRRAAITELTAPAGAGHLVTNPPYGVRVGQRRELHALYAALGRMVRERFPGWKFALLTADDRLSAATGLELVERLATRNGGIRVRLLSAEVPARTRGHVRGNDSSRTTLEGADS